MSTILQQIISDKRMELEEIKKVRSYAYLEQKVRTRPLYSLQKRLTEPYSSGIIAEFKRKSPSKGIINNGATLAGVVTQYEAGGAAGISVLSNGKYFGGSVADVEEACRLVKIPVLRKEFIVDAYQILESHRMGADVILLIAAALTPGEVSSLSAYARSLGLEVLLEIHHSDELKHICPGITMVGVNNRNLHTFETSLSASHELAKLLPSELIKISESGISTIEHVVELRRSGFRGFLMGENFMRENNPGMALQDFAREAVARMSEPELQNR